MHTWEKIFVLVKGWNLFHVNIALCYCHASRKKLRSSIHTINNIRSSTDKKYIRYTGCPEKNGTLYKSMPNIRFLSILLDEKYMALYMWLFSINCPNFVKNYSSVFKLLSMLGMRVKTHSKMTSIFSSCHAHSV